jgi:hypothetical protein
MPGPAGTTTHLIELEPSPLGVAVPTVDEDPAATDLLRRHGARAVLAASATLLLAARQSDRLDAFEAATFGLDRSAGTPAPAPTALAAPTTDDTAFDAFERDVFGLHR